MMQRESGGLCLAQTVPLCSCRLDTDGGLAASRFLLDPQGICKLFGENTWAAIAESA